jgi:hypothetical protein
MLFAASACADIAYANTQPVPDGMPSTAEFLKSAAPYPYLAPPQRAARITSGAQRLAPCMTKSMVEGVLGRPDYSRLNYGPKGPGEKWLGSSWAYYLAKRDSGANEYDPRVDIFFDRNDRAHWIVIVGIPGAKSIAAPNDRCT